MNLPNSITFARLVLTAVFVIAASRGGFSGYLVALVAFVMAAISDWLDGYLARKLNLVTSLGKLMDPLADKILVASAFVLFSSVGLCPPWITIVIIGREFLVTGLRQIAVEKGEVIAADRLGKWKTTFQLTYSITCLVWLMMGPIENAGSFVSFFQTLSNPENPLSIISLWGAFALTLISGINYLKKSWNLLIN
ncbi:MAG TPA: CDP-diacylglycerol--glycerol-3-phosphate 3-phosphatidyltransferase [Verrucomicrobiales bacterium]|nr:CDP-diacylglycerol--glycerol-3-phosphate 3-phosphatidyltransferase [Verrucomicrobiales bacterium]HBE96540.1 CDP-diacylglycerol--glycerol-3-phosphate 3-phosphatidyltransferase [Verrucomicrobiales bacterium]